VGRMKANVGGRVGAGKVSRVRKSCTREGSVEGTEKGTIYTKGVGAVRGLLIGIPGGQKSTVLERQQGVSCK